MYEHTCPECGSSYKSIGLHWYRSSCNYPSISTYKIDILTGVLMGDGWVCFSSENACIEVVVVEEEYLEYLQSVFGCLGRGVRLSKVSEDIAPDGRGEYYSDQYRWSTASHPSLNKFRGWYGDRGKKFPEDIDMSPTVMKHWYVCDGHLQRGKYPSIGVTNEVENKEKIESYFDQMGVGVRWRSEEVVVESDYIDEFFGAVGGPLPGFEYKWPEEYRKT